MTNIVLLNKVTHRDVTVDGRPSAAYGDNLRFAPVVVREFAQLVVHYPILFSKNPETGEFFCGAMLGFDEGENLFLDDWRERDVYRPLALQRMPFYARGPELAIDLDHPRVGAEGGKPLFTENGEPTRYLKSIMWTFQDIKLGTEATQAFIQQLLQLKLLEPIEVEVEFDDGTRRHCLGLYTINQDALPQLPDPIVLNLFRCGALQLIYMMVSSLKHVPLLARKKNAKLLPSNRDFARAS